MEVKGTGQLLRIYIGADDRYGNKPLFEAIVLRLREIGMAGATVLRGIEGFGADSRVLHTSRLLRLSADLPILIEVAETEENIARSIEEVERILEDVGCGSLMTLEKVEIIRCKPSG